MVQNVFLILAGATVGLLVGSKVPVWVAWLVGGVAALLLVLLLID